MTESEMNFTEFFLLFGRSRIFPPQVFTHNQENQLIILSSRFCLFSFDFHNVCKIYGDDESAVLQIAFHKLQVLNLVTNFFTTTKLAVKSFPLSAMEFGFQDDSLPNLINAQSELSQLWESYEILANSEQNRALLSIFIARFVYW